jgi:hypothetical protein
MWWVGGYLSGFVRTVTGVDGLKINPLRKALGVIVKTPIRAIVKSLNIEPCGL